MGTPLPPLISRSLSDLFRPLVVSVNGDISTVIQAPAQPTAIAILKDMRTMTGTIFLTPLPYRSRLDALHSRIEGFPYALHLFRRLRQARRVPHAITV